MKCFSSYCLIVKLCSLFINSSHTQNLMILNNIESKGITCALLESENGLSLFIQLFRTRIYLLM